MATTSTVPSVKTALVTLIGSALSGIQVTYGRPADDKLNRECVYVAEAIGTHRVPVFKAGRKPREERYSVEVVVAVIKGRGDVTDSESRAFTLLAAVEDAVANDPTLGAVDGLVHATAGSWETAAEQTAEGPAAVIRFNVDCLARIA
jgi:hypothetical protein